MEILSNTGGNAIKKKPEKKHKILKDRQETKRGVPPPSFNILITYKEPIFNLVV
jgi:hypothetical protein